MRNTEDSILIVLLIVTSMNLVSANQENQIKDNYIVEPQANLTLLLEILK